MYFYLLFLTLNVPPGVHVPQVGNLGTPDIDYERWRAEGGNGSKAWGHPKSEST